ncbi:hypothetical protein GCM10009839_76430 [Catenulispora yoronensis]|uniref:STAS domain-containing protein n=1 Tax=Catenulispora yoronensis TaxID=450799 RepID=A0ABP5H037_9ACTN
MLYDASAIDRPTREDLQRLARLRLDARRSGCDLVLTGVGQRLRLLLAVTGLEEVFTISPDGMCGAEPEDSGAEPAEPTEPAEPATPAEQGEPTARAEPAEPHKRRDPGGG